MNGKKGIGKDGFRVSAFGGGVDLDGNPVERTRADYPYSYDPYVTYKRGDKKDMQETVYSDRLMQWDSGKFNKSCQTVWGNQGQYFDNRTPATIEKFLQEYYSDNSIVLMAVMQGANHSNGYPYWIFFFNRNKSK